MQDMTPDKRIAIIGGGIIGASAALYLQSDGHDVTIFEPEPEGEPASCGNAGHIGAASVVPWANPANRRTACSARRDRLHPLSFRLSDMLRNPGWIARFLAASTARRSECGARHLKALLSLCFSTLEPLLVETGVGHLLRRDGLLHVFGDEASYCSAAEGFALRERHGIRVTHLSADEVIELEPALRPRGNAPSFHRAVLLPDVGQILCPRSLRGAYLAHFRARGGTIRTVPVWRVREADGQARLSLACGQSETFDFAVITAGTASSTLVRGMGVRVPLIAERGYHLQFAERGDLLTRSVLYVDRRVVLSPTAAGLRLTTGAEFTRPDRPPEPDRMMPIFEAARDLVPGIPPLSHARNWSGDRPSTPDSLPIIGPAPRAPSVLLAYGHGHTGLTMAAPTAAILSDIAAGRPARLDLSPYAADRSMAG